MLTYDDRAGRIKLHPGIMAHTVTTAYENKPTGPFGGKMIFIGRVRASRSAAGWSHGGRGSRPRTAWASSGIAVMSSDSLGSANPRRSAGGDGA